MAPKDPAMQTSGNAAANPPAAPIATMPPNAPAPKPAPPQPNVIQKTFRAEALARIQRAVLTDCGFVERLVVFWSNHFCISAAKGGLARMWAGSFEREAIRPHVLGRFADMLKAVEQHPAMLFFLDNQQSLGPDSRAGINRKRGLNENLAREIMELHTLGVGGGYTQDDVTSLSRVITGWTFAGRQGQLGAPGSFVFNANAHEPGAQRVLGKSYSAGGVEQGEAVLSDIARHPSTAARDASWRQRARAHQRRRRERERVAARARHKARARLEPARRPDRSQAVPRRGAWRLADGERPPDASDPNALCGEREGGASQSGCVRRFCRRVD